MAHNVLYVAEVSSDLHLMSSLCPKDIEKQRIAITIHPTNLARVTPQRGVAVLPQTASDYHGGRRCWSCIQLETSW